MRDLGLHGLGNMDVAEEAKHAHTREGNMSNQHRYLEPPKCVAQPCTHV